MGQKAEWADVRRILAEYGFDVQLARSGHYAVYREGARLYTLPCSSSDWRAYRNTCSDIRRFLGVDIRQRPEKRKK